MEFVGIDIEIADIETLGIIRGYPSLPPRLA